MSLPNFVNFEPFNILRRKMRAEGMGHFDFQMPERAAEQPAATSKPARRSRRRKPAAKVDE